jgi:peptidoglycan/xylan/chitin deacetylase (PgdA/CDA1 family)
MSFRPGVSILMYHQVGHFSNVTRLRANYCQVEDFERHMAFLRACCYQVVSLTDAVRALKGEIDPGSHSVAVTFDDGYVNFAEQALPVLEKYQIPATVYAVAGMAGGQSDWLYDDNLTPAPLMNVEQMRTVQKSGLVTIGSHAISHPRLTRIPADVMADEVVRSRRILENALQTPVEHICYPYGDHNVDVIDVARAAGYISGTTIVKGLATPQHDPLALPRKAMSFGEGRYRLWRNLHFKNGKLGKNLVRVACRS